MKTKFRKSLLLCLSLLLVVSVCMLSLTACNPTEPDDGGETVKLDVPTQLAVDASGNATWKRVSGADSYELDVNGTVVPVKFTTYDLYEHPDRPNDGKFVLKVRALDKQGNASDWSAEITYTMSGGKLMYPVINGIENGIITWDANSNASDIVFTVNGAEKDVAVNATSYDLSAESGESLTISITYKGDGVYYQDSSTATVIYYPETGVMQLPAPQNVHMEGQILMFDAVVGADTYYLRDYNNSVVSVTSNVIDLSSGFLTKSVSAGNSQGFYETSTETDVVYFSEGNGNGTAEDPFVITTADQLRYIEFYEGIGLSMYYELGSDIEFEEIELADDEYGSNTYKLGSFSGVLDGKGHSIKNTTVYYIDGYSSLFDSINEEAVVKNLVFENADWRTWTKKTNDGIMHEKGGDVAILCFTNRGLVENVTVRNSSVVAVNDGAASLVSINRGTIVGCTVESTVTISGNKETGGIAIYNQGTVSDCVNRATIEGNLSTGGIVGRNAGNVAMCDNYGIVTGKNKVGGIVGYNYNVLLDGEYQYSTMVRYCSNHGNVEGVTDVGGIAGVNGNDGTGEIGSLVVAGAGLFYSYNTADVKGLSTVGGIAGNNYASTSKTRGMVGCFNTGNISVDEEIGSQYQRIYLNAGETNYWITADNAVIYCYFWGTGGSTTWPGEQMTHFMVGDQNYFYIDIKMDFFEGIIFSRGNYSGAIYNQTPDITSITGNLYTFGAGFETGSWSMIPSDIANSIPNVCGGLAGYNTMFTDCFLLSGSAENVSVANGTKQQNKVVINGIETETSSAILSAEQMNSAEFVARLNEISQSSNWTTGDNCPKFAWQ